MIKPKFKIGDSVYLRNDRFNQFKIKKIISTFIPYEFIMQYSYQCLENSDICFYETELQFFNKPDLKYINYRFLND